MAANRSLRISSRSACSILHSADRKVGGAMSEVATATRTRTGIV